MNSKNFRWVKLLEVLVKYLLMLHINVILDVNIVTMRVVETIVLWIMS